MILIDERQLLRGEVVSIVEWDKHGPNWREIVIPSAKLLIFSLRDGKEGLHQCSGTVPGGFIEVAVWEAHCFELKEANAEKGDSKTEEIEGEEG